MIGLNKYLQAKIRTQCRINGEHVFWGQDELPVHVIGDQKKIVLPGTKITASLEDLIRIGAKVIQRPRHLTKQEIKHAKFSTIGGIVRWNRHSLPTNVYIANKRTIDKARDDGREPPKEKYIGRIGKFRTATYGSVDEVLQALRDKLYVN